MNAKITPQDRQKIYDGVDAGKSGREIAEETGLSPAVVGYHATKYRKSLAGEEATEDQDTKEEVQEESEVSVIQDLYQKILDAKDDHIRSLERIIEKGFEKP